MIGRYRIIAASTFVGALALTLAAVAFGTVMGLVAVAIAIQLTTSLLLALLIIDSRHRTEDRIQQLEKKLRSTVRTTLTDEDYLQELRSWALPQQHVEQVLRIIDARHAHLETYLEQIRDDMTDLRRTRHRDG